MKKYTFRGGVHPSDCKEATCHIPISVLPPPDELVIPLRQHIGAPCESLVKKGDYVLMGQKIGDSTSFVSAPVHSPVSGVVTDIKPHLHPSGEEVMSIIIQNDHKDNACETIVENDLDVTNSKEVLKFIENISAEKIKENVKEAGITGMGGAAFPLHVKLSPPPDVKIDTVILNGAECEPYLTSDHRVMLENSDFIIVGLLLLMKAVNAQKGVIGIEENKPDAISAMKKAAEKYPKIDVSVLSTKYPQGSEKQLINALTGKEVPSGGLPSAVGVLVNNVDTCTATANAVLYHMPLFQRIVTVSGDAIKTPQNLKVRVGTPFSYVIEAAGGFTTHPEKVVMGGPMMGIAQVSTNAPVIKGTSGILAFIKNKMFSEKEGDCIRCGRCVTVCPMRLMPLYISMYAQMGDYEKAKQYHILDCMECGSCSFTCPQRRFMVQHIKTAKAKIAAMKK